MGGFAGGLVATALLQQLTTLKSALDELGGSFDVMTPNIDKLTESLGLAGTAEGRRLKMIERTQGAHVALEVATEKMNQMIGEEGVKQLKEFSELSKAAGNNFKIGATKFQLFAATVLNFLSKISGFGDATKKRTIEEGVALGAKLGKKEALDIQAEQKRIDAIPKVDQLQIIPSGVGGLVPIITKVKSKEAEAAQLILDKRKQEFKVVADKLALDIERQDKLNEGLKSITDQNTFLQNQLELGKQGAEIEKLKVEMANQMEIKVKDLTKEQVEQIKNSIKLRDELTKINELYSSIASTIETGIVDAIEGAINGTKTLGDVARSVFTQIQRSLIQAGVSSFLDNLPFKIPGRAEGGPVKGGRSFIVGERGPELFTPGVSGMITPNHALGGSTSIVVNVDASGSSVEGDEQGGRELGRLISVAIQSELIQQKRPGGLLS